MRNKCKGPEARGSLAPVENRLCAAVAGTGLGNSCSSQTGGSWRVGPVWEQTGRGVGGTLINGSDKSCHSLSWRGPQEGWVWGVGEEFDFARVHARHPHGVEEAVGPVRPGLKREVRTINRRYLKPPEQMKSPRELIRWRSALGAEPRRHCSVKKLERWGGAARRLGPGAMGEALGRRPCPCPWRQRNGEDRPPPTPRHRTICKGHLGCELRIERCIYRHRGHWWPRQKHPKGCVLFIYPEYS